MRYTRLLLLAIALCSSCIDTNKKNRSKEKSAYFSVDKRSQSVPDSIGSSNALAAYLVKPYSSTEKRVRAIHVWISRNIKYDITEKDAVYNYESDAEIASETFESKKGVCFHYAQLFNQMCRSIGIESFVIEGYTRDKASGKVADIGHAWNAVKIGDSYYLIDNTWAAGYILNDNYVHDFRDEIFLVQPKDFIKTHMPFDVIWQFLGNPISHIEFERNDFRKLDKLGNYDYEDSIKALEGLSQIDLLTQENKRIRKSGVSNNLIEQKLQHNIALIESNKYTLWVKQFNGITKSLNKASKNFKSAVELNNEFIRYLNRRTAKTEAEEEEMRQIISKAVKYYIQGKNSMDKTRKGLSQLKYQSGVRNKMKYVENETKKLQKFILELESNLIELKASLKLHALHADINLS